MDARASSDIAQSEHIAVMRAVVCGLADLPLALKGGTALLLCCGLDRFSEDIDLDGRKKVNLQNRIAAILTRMTKTHDIRIVKDTDTVQRLKIRYETTKAAGMLKVEVSYRQGFQDSDIVSIDGVKTYAVAKLIEQKLNALEGRTTARDLYDVAFLAQQYANDFSSAALARALAIASDVNALESRFRPAFEADDLFADKANVDSVILRLVDSLSAIPFTF
jgi:predicted nucleotidyltransferase component of viral defense system